MRYLVVVVGALCASWGAVAAVAPSIMQPAPVPASQPAAQPRAAQTGAVSAPSASDAPKVQVQQRPAAFQPPGSLNPMGVVVKESAVTAVPQPRAAPTPTTSTVPAARAAPVQTYPEPVAVAAPQPQKPKKSDLEYPKRKQGRPLYLVRTSMPYSEVIMYSGKCSKNDLPQFRQLAIDRGISKRSSGNLYYAVANTEDGGRSTGCWFRDRVSRTIRVMLQDGRGEIFAQEQIDYAN